MKLNVKFIQKKMMKIPISSPSRTSLENFAEWKMIHRDSQRDDDGIDTRVVTERCDFEILQISEKRICTAQSTNRIVVHVNFSQFFVVLEHVAIQNSYSVLVKENNLEMDIVAEQCLVNVHDLISTQWQLFEISQVSEQIDIQWLYLVVTQHEIL